MNPMAVTVFNSSHNSWLNYSRHWPMLASIAIYSSLNCIYTMLRYSLCDSCTVVHYLTTTWECRTSHFRIQHFKNNFRSNNSNNAKNTFFIILVSASHEANRFSYSATRLGHYNYSSCNPRRFEIDAWRRMKNVSNFHEIHELPLF